MKKFTVPCDFGGVTSPFTIYIGEPEANRHPLHFQADWLSKNRGGTIPGDVMDSISKLFDLSKKNNVSFEELCVYALTSDENTPAKNSNTSQARKIEAAPPPPAMDFNERHSTEEEDAEERGGYTTPETQELSAPPAPEQASNTPPATNTAAPPPTEKPQTEPSTKRAVPPPPPPPPPSFKKTAPEENNT